MAFLFDALCWASGIGLDVFIVKAKDTAAIGILYFNSIFLTI